MNIYSKFKIHLLISLLSLISFLISYIFISPHNSINIPFIGTMSLSNFLLGISLSISMGSIGILMISLGRNNLYIEEASELRHPIRTSIPTIEEMKKDIKDLKEESKDIVSLSKRKGFKYLLLLSLILLFVSPLSLFIGLFKGNINSLRYTLWSKKEHRLIINSMSKNAIKSYDVPIGSLIYGEPYKIHSLSNYQNELAKSAIIITRFDINKLNIKSKKLSYKGIVAYSKICTHVGCPVGLFQRRTGNVLCPCHQSTFALKNNGSVIFGPAVRSLPQLPLTVDKDNNLIAKSDFLEPVGPVCWECADK